MIAGEGEGDGETCDSVGEGDGENSNGSDEKTWIPAKLSKSICSLISMNFHN